MPQKAVFSPHTWAVIEKLHVASKHTTEFRISHNQILTFKKLIKRVQSTEPSTKDKLEREKLNVKSLLWFQHMKEVWRVSAVESHYVIRVL